MTNLTTEYMGLTLRNPLIAGSSGMTDNKENILKFEKHGIGGVVLKSLFEEEIIVEKRSNIGRMGSGGFLYPEIELNLFILPSDLNRSAEENEKIYFQIINEVVKQVKIPVAVKISYYFSNLGTMIKRLSETNISGIVLFNRFYSPDFDIDTFDITSGNVLSSPGDLALSLRWIAIMAERVSCDLAASTGVQFMRYFRGYPKNR